MLPVLWLDFFSRSWIRRALGKAKFFSQTTPFQKSVSGKTTWYSSIARFAGRSSPSRSRSLFRCIQFGLWCFRKELEFSISSELVSCRACPKFHMKNSKLFASPWKLSRVIFWCWGYLVPITRTSNLFFKTVDTVDRFACSYNAKVPRFNTRFFQTGCAAVDAFSQDWRHDNNWICPPVCLLIRVVKEMELCKARGNGYPSLVEVFLLLDCIL